ncbi:MAG TPA: S66 peptidase family protein [Jatrophihabitans sp.]|nr:S66 peptidase family protein [Jatrophihabitans sp.]
MPDLIRPPALSPGDTIAIVSLSSGLAGALPARYAAGKRQLAETFGVQVVDAPHATAAPGWLREHPEARAADLHWALANPDVHGIVSAIGGEDSIRLLPHLDLDLIRRHPKVFTGYSDTTVQHLVHRCAGVGSFYGLALFTTAAENGGMHPFSVDSIRRTAFSTEPIGQLSPAPEWTEELLDWRDESLQQQRRRWVPNYGWLWLQGDEPVTGPVIGGCLEILTMCQGTEIFPPLDAFDGAVLHLEVSEEKPPVPQIGHWLRSFTALGITERIGALLFSRPEDRSLRETLQIYQTVRTELREAGRPDLPFVANLDFGHSSPMGLLPLGRRVTVDPAAQRISIDEAAVC